MGLIHLWEMRQAWDPFVLEMKSWNQNPKLWQLGMLTQVYTARGGTQVVS